VIIRRTSPQPGDRQGFLVPSRYRRAWTEPIRQPLPDGETAQDVKFTLQPSRPSNRFEGGRSLVAQHDLQVGWTTSGTHGIASLYETFEPDEAFALAQRLEVHHTPKHGSWLNITEIELSALTRQCLDRRIDNLDSLNAELTEWQHATNTDQRQVRWQFTTEDARIKLRHLYPQI
jgi:hypothetical protein